ADRRRDPPELVEQEAPGGRVVARRERERAEVQRDGPGGLRLVVERRLRRLPCIRIDERHVDALARQRRDEEKLVALRHGLLHDGSREWREEVALDGPLERAGPELRREALLDDELVRRVVDLDGPRAPAQAAPREGVRQLLVEQCAHLLALEGPEDDETVDP